MAELTQAISRAIDSSTGSEVTKADANVAAVKTVMEMKADPVLANATNQEPKVQSRIVWGGTSGLGASLIALLIQVSKHGKNYAAYDWEVVVPALVAFWAAGYTLYGRLVPGLKPMFYGWFGR